MKKIYISGKITGLDANVAVENFAKAELFLKGLYDCHVINPMVEVPYEMGKTWEEYMIDDIKLLFDCDHIYMLNNWTDSKGAIVEYGIARSMGKVVFFESK